MKDINLKQYFIVGAVVTMLSILVIPLMDMLIEPGMTYFDGLTSVFTYILAVVAGVSFGSAMYRMDREK